MYAQRVPPVEAVMTTKVLTSSEARRNLPSLIKHVAEGRGRVYIGPQKCGMAGAAQPRCAGGVPRVGQRGARVGPRIRHSMLC